MRISVILSLFVTVVKVFAANLDLESQGESLEAHCVGEHAGDSAASDIEAPAAQTDLAEQGTIHCTRKFRLYLNVLPLQFRCSISRQYEENQYVNERAIEFNMPARIGRPDWRDFNLFIGHDSQSETPRQDQRTSGCIIL